MADEQQEQQGIEPQISKGLLAYRKIVGATQGFIPSDQIDKALRDADLPDGVPRNVPDTNPLRSREYRLIEARCDIWIGSEAAVTDGAFTWEGGKCKIDDATGIAALIFAPSNEHGAMAIRCTVSFFNRTAHPVIIRSQLDRLAEQMMTEYFRHKRYQ